MSTLKNRLLLIERKLTEKEEQASTVDYLVKYVNASDGKRAYMDKPVITIGLLKEILDESIDRAIDRMTDEEIETRLKVMEEEEKAAHE